LNQGNQVLYQ
jgi:hypothetical protein